MNMNSQDRPKKRILWKIVAVAAALLFLSVIVVEIARQGMKPLLLVMLLLAVAIVALHIWGLIEVDRGG